MATISAQRLGDLLRTDPAFIIAFILGNNPDAVADKVGVVLGNRPYNREGIEQGLQVLLNHGRAKDVVSVLDVPLDLARYNEEQALAIYAAAGTGASPNSLARHLATQAMRLYEAYEVPPETETTTLEEVVKAVDPSTSTPQNRRKLWRVVGIGLAIVGLVVVVAAVVNYARKKS